MHECDSCMHYYGMIQSGLAKIVRIAEHNMDILQVAEVVGSGDMLPQKLKMALVYKMLVA